MQPPADAPDLHRTPPADPTALSDPALSDPAQVDPTPADAGPAAVEARVPAPREPEPVALSERDEQILAFERKWWKHAGSKEQAVRDTFGLSATRYYQLLNGLLDNPAALAHDPVLVGRLRRLRSTRARTRRR